LQKLRWTGQITKQGQIRVREKMRYSRLEVEISVYNFPWFRVVDGESDNEGAHSRGKVKTETGGCKYCDGQTK
jgi:hypothetical protein